MNHEQLLSALQWRYATKKFDSSKKISAADWHVLEESLRLSPSSYGMEPWKFHVVENPALREKLKAASWGQTQVTDASHYVVLTFKEKITDEDVADFIQRTASGRGMPAEALAQYQGMISGDLVQGLRSKTIDVWSQRQTYIAMGFVALAAAVLKIDTCLMEGLDPSAYDELLGIKGSGYRTVAAVALGYRHAEDKYASAKKIRKDSAQVIHYHR
nr:NAD(P)H-dependent oxidoreductase [Pseudomonadota bacterium]